MIYRIETYDSIEEKWEGIDHFLPDLPNYQNLIAPHFTKKRKFKGKFYFTKKGYNKFGKPLLKLLSNYPVSYRVKKLKDKRLSTIYKDKYQKVGHIKTKKSQ